MKLNFATNQCGSGLRRQAWYYKLVRAPCRHKVREGTIGDNGGRKRLTRKSEGYKVGFPGVVVQGVPREPREVILSEFYNGTLPSNPDTLLQTPTL